MQQNTYTAYVFVLLSTIPSLNRGSLSAYQFQTSVSISGPPSLLSQSPSCIKSNNGIQATKSTNQCSVCGSQAQMGPVSKQTIIMFEVAGPRRQTNNCRAQKAWLIRPKPTSVSLEPCTWCFYLPQSRVMTNLPIIEWLLSCLTHIFTSKCWY